jgi:hypothetical protein
MSRFVCCASCIFEYMRYITPKSCARGGVAARVCLLSPRRAMKSLSLWYSLTISTTKREERAACVYCEVLARIPRMRHRT